MQGIAGLAAIVPRILAATGQNPSDLPLVALLVLGAAILLAGNALSGAAMTTTKTPVGESWAQQQQNGWVNVRCHGRFRKSDASDQIMRAWASARSPDRSERTDATARPHEVPMNDRWRIHRQIAIADISKFSKR